MSINAINSLSLYEYYYKINDEDKKKKSPLADEMEKYGLTPTDDEALNASMLKQAKLIEKNNNQSQEKAEISPSDRPWADLMYQLNIRFNDDPKDDIQDIKDELAKLTQGIDDKELLNEVKDLEDYAENLYLAFSKNSISNDRIDSSSLLYSQLANMSMVNMASLQ